MFDAFVNYVRSPERATPVNLGAARVVLGLYLVWKVLSLNWAAIGEWPVPVYQYHEPFLFPDITVPLLGLEKWVLVVALVAFTVGYRIRLVGFLAALLVSHMAGLRLPFNPSGGTEAMFVAAYFLLFFALYADQDRLSVDGFRRTASMSRATLDATLRGERTERFRMSALRWCLVTMGVLYFGAGIQKILLNPGFSWTQPDSLARYMTMNSFADHDYRPVAELFARSDLVLSGLSWSTLVLEIGLLVVGLAGRSITPFVLGLIGFHLGIAFALDPFFFDFIVFLLLFTAFDSVLTAVTWSRPLTVVYDAQHRGSVRRLVPFKLLDVNDVLSFTPFASTDHPDRPDASLLVVSDGESYHGYAGFRKLVDSCRLFAPVSLLLRVDRVEQLVRDSYRATFASAAERASGDVGRQD